MVKLNPRNIKLKLFYLHGTNFYQGKHICIYIDRSPFLKFNRQIISMLTYLEARFSAHAHSSYDYKCVSMCENQGEAMKPRKYKEADKRREDVKNEER